MKGPTHLIGGFAAAAITAPVFGVITHEPILFYSAALIGALIPDICHPQSTVGRIIPFISKPIARIFGHRTITHSLLFVISVMWLTRQFPGVFSTDFQHGLIVGISSHILLDAMTTRGVKFLYPLKIRCRFPFYFFTGSEVGEKVVSGLLVVLIVMTFIV